MSRPHLILILILVIPAAAAAQPGRLKPRPRAKGNEAGRVLASVVAPRLARALVADLARHPGREQGSGAAGAAIAWLHDWLGKTGLHAEVVDERRRQYPFHRVTRCEIPGRPAKPLRSAFFPPSIPAIKGTYDVVLAGDDVEVKDRVALVVSERGRILERQVGALSRRGAKAVLFGVGGRDLGEDVAAVSDWIAVQSPVVTLGARDTRRLASAAKRGDARITLEVESGVGTGRQKSVVARVEGKAPAAGEREVVVVGASLPAYGNGPGGTDDAAIAAVLLMARALHLSVKADVEPLPFDVCFAIWADGEHSFRRWSGERSVRAVVHVDPAGAGTQSAIHVGTKPRRGRDAAVLARIARPALEASRGRPGFWGKVSPWPKNRGVSWSLGRARSLVLLTTTPFMNEDPGSARVAGANCCPLGRTTADRAETVGAADASVTCARAGLVLLARMGEELAR